MKQWGKNWFYRVTFITVILMLIAGVFYLFRKLILAGSGRYASYDVTQEGQAALLEKAEIPSAGTAVPLPAPSLSERTVPAESKAGEDMPGPVPGAEAPDPGFEAPPAGTADFVSGSEASDPAAETSGSGAYPSDPAAPRILDPEKPIVALTFDDGPGRGTAAILDLLKQYDARATFFVIGLCLEEPAQVEKLRQAAELGCVIGSHTYDHISFKELDAGQIRSQTERVNELLVQYAGTPAPFVLPPYGHITDEAREAADMPYIHWSLDTQDWLSRDAQSIVAAVQENVRDGDIILMHDIYPSTAEACETLIPWLIEQGYQLATVPEMMEARGITMENGQMYKDAR